MVKREEDRLLTPDEAITYLRLDSVGLKKPEEALRYLRRLRRLGSVKVGKVYMYLKSDLDKYIDDYRQPPIDWNHGRR